MWKKLININKILVPVDLTHNSICAVEAALTLTKEKKTQIYLIHVMNKVGGNAPSGNGGKGTHETPSTVEEYRALEEFFLKKIKPRSSFVYIVRSGNPSAEILTFAREEAVDLVVLPIGMKGEQDSISSGGIACRIIENATVPVLIVKPETIVKKLSGSRQFPGTEGQHAMAHDERILQEIRQRICTKCTDRTASGLCITSTFDSCAINRYLPEIIDIVLNTGGRNIGTYINGLKENVCSRCEHQSPDGICDRRDNLECALDRYFPLVIEAILEVRGKSA